MMFPGNPATVARLKWADNIRNTKVTEVDLIHYALHSTALRNEAIIEEKEKQGLNASIEKDRVYRLTELMEKFRILMPIMDKDGIGASEDQVKEFCGEHYEAV